MVAQNLRRRDIAAIPAQTLHLADGGGSGKSNDQVGFSEALKKNRWSDKGD